MTDNTIDENSFNPATSFPVLFSDTPFIQCEYFSTAFFSGPYHAGLEISLQRFDWSSSSLPPEGLGVPTRVPQAAVRLSLDVAYMLAMNILKNLQESFTAEQRARYGVPETILELTNNDGI